MKKLVYVLLFFGFTKINAQLSGSAFLNGQTNHAGIKVKFIAGPGTAVTDSTLTNANGTYSFNISGGIYAIVFSKTGYQSAYYNNNVPIVLTNTTVLTSVSLYPGNIVNVSGIVSGNWQNTNIYIASGDLTIPPGSTLTIQPGTVVKFNGSYSLTANGVLNATGAASNKITFSSNNVSPAAGDWGGLVLNNSQSIVKHCLIEYSQNGISVTQSSPAIEDNEIRNFSWNGITLTMNSSSLVKNNVIHDYTTNPYGFGITTYNGNATITCNSIYDGTGRGMNIGDASLIKNNLIYNIAGPERGYGIDCYFASNARIENNIVHHCVDGIRYGENVGNGPTPLIINNTLYNNTNGINSAGMMGHATITGNIVANNVTGIVQSADPGSTPANVSYNLLWNNTANNFLNVQIIGLGQVVNTNSNGDPIDSYYNLFKDPLFVNNTAPYYSSASPCINAGNSNYSPNIGCDPAAMCTSMILGIKEAEKNFKPQVFPNPFVSLLTLTGLKTDKISAATFYDLSGKMHEAAFEAKSGASLNIKVEGLTPGIYFLEITFSNSSKEYIRVIKE